jgi:hypothetical protein
MFQIMSDVKAELWRMNAHLARMRAVQRLRSCCFAANRSGAANFKEISEAADKFFRRACGRSEDYRRDAKIIALSCLIKLDPTSRSTE